MDIEDFLRDRGGVARTAGISKAGIRRTLLDKALKAGRIVRIRRGVYALADEGGALGFALKHNEHLTCLSAAPLYQLWTLQKSSVLHVSPGHKSAVPGTLAHGRIVHAVHPGFQRLVWQTS